MIYDAPLTRSTPLIPPIPLILYRPFFPPKTTSCGAANCKMISAHRNPRKHITRLNRIRFHARLDRHPKDVPFEFMIITFYRFLCALSRKWRPCFEGINYIIRRSNDHNVKPRLVTEPTETIAPQSGLREMIHRGPRSLRSRTPTEQSKQSISRATPDRFDAIAQPI